MHSNMRAALRSPEMLWLSALSLLTRLYDLFEPRAVVWDEVHFERFTAAYFTGRYYIDVHPPLGKLLFYWAAKVLGVSGAALASNQSTPALRLLPALSGALIIPVVYLLMRELRASRRVATLAAVLLLVDNALLVESRLILMDAMLILAGMVAVLGYVAARHRVGPKRWTFLVISAIAAGVAASIKWTGLSALGLILLHWGIDGLLRRRRFWPLAQEMALLTVIPLIIYLGSFAVHFALLPNDGIGSMSMSPEFRATLRGSANAVPGATVPFLQSFRELNHVMGVINIGWATDHHPGASPWYTWPIAKHSIGMWTLATPDGERWIVLFANTVVWLGTVAGMLIMAGAALLRRAALRARVQALLFLAAGYAINLVPFAFIKRPMFLYHYFFALIFSVMLAALGVGALAGWDSNDDDEFWQFSSVWSRRVYVGIITLAAAAFLYAAPVSYGWPLTPAQFLHRRMLIERRLSPN